MSSDGESELYGEFTFITLSLIAAGFLLVAVVIAAEALLGR